MLSKFSGPYDALANITPQFQRAPEPVPLPPMGTGNTYTGDSGDNTKNGTSGDDVFNMYQGGHDTVFGNGGDDAIHFGGTFGVNDVVRGGDGTDTLFLTGDTYSGGLTITGGMLQGVEILSLSAGHSYDFTTNDSVVAAGAELLVNAAALGVGRALDFDGSAETNGTFVLAGGLSDDELIGGSGNDDFYSAPSTTSGGFDFMSGGGGNDRFFFTGDLTAEDVVFGGNGGFDVIELNGDYSAGVTLSAGVIGVEEIYLFASHDYQISTVDQNVAAGQFFDVNASVLESAHSLVFNGASESDGHFSISGGRGDDTITGGSQSDTFGLNLGGGDTAYGGAGDDFFLMLDAFTGQDRLHGGDGNDTLEIGGKDYDLTITGAMIGGIETIQLDSGNSYTLKTTDAAVPNGTALVIDGTQVDLLHSVGFDGSADTDGAFQLYGGHGDDTLVGGAGSDQIQGNAGADTLAGGGHPDYFQFPFASDSSGEHFDTIIGFDAHNDFFYDPGGITHLDATVTHGDLSPGSINHDLNAALDSALHANHAILFKPDGGDLDGATFLVIDGNATAGYQSGHDYVIQLDGPLHMQQLSTANFLG